MSDPLADVPGFLRQVDFFASLDDDDRAHLASVARVMKLEAGTEVFAEGQPGDAMYVVVFGQVRVVRRAPDGETVELAAIGPRGVFGEMALFDDVERSATVRAGTRTVALLAIRRDDFLALVRDHVELVLHMLAGQSRRVRQLNDRLVAVDHEARKHAPSFEELVTTEYPHPIAQVFQDAFAQSEPRPRLQRCFELAEVVLLYVSSLARAAYVAADLPRGEIDRDLWRGARGMTLGQHIAIIRSISVHLVETHSRGGVPAHLHAWLVTRKGNQRLPELLDRLLNARNRLKHGAEATLDEPELQRLVADIEPVVVALVESIGFVTRLPLVMLTSMRFLEGTFRYTTQRCHGAFRTFRTEAMTLSTPHELERLYVHDSDAGTLLPLFPWMAAQRCEVCGDRDVFYARGISRKQIELIEFERGHAFAIGDLPSSVGATLDAWRERIRGTEHDVER